MKLLKTPEKYFKCEDYESFKPSLEARTDCNEKGCRLLSIELTELGMANNRRHRQCYNSIRDIKQYQEGVK